MQITLHDLENPHSPEHDLQIDSAEELTSVLDRLQHREPFILELESGHGSRLTVGLGGPIACAQHSPASGDPPYLVAIGNPASTNIKDEVTFLCGGTPTPVPNRRCIPFATLKRVAIHFLNTGQPSPEIQWEET